MTETAPDPSPLFRMMLLIRRAEERISRLFADGEIPGFIHLSIGQEAIAAGVCACLGPADTVASTHRGHGHGLAKGMSLHGLFAELMGKPSGLCAGRGGSMHVTDLSVGMLGANGIVGAGLPIAAGSALAHSVRGGDAIAVCFFGDGALGEGVMHETLNLAALWRLPLLLVCENNGWAEFTPGHLSFASSLSAVAGAFGIPTTEVDGDDVLAVHAATAAAVAAIRAGGGPRALDCRTHRVHGHFEGDPQRYRDSANQAAAKAADPLLRIAALIGDAAGVEAEIAGLIDGAVAGARQAAAHG